MIQASRVCSIRILQPIPIRISPPASFHLQGALRRAAPAGPLPDLRRLVRRISGPNAPGRLAAVDRAAPSGANYSLTWLSVYHKTAASVNHIPRKRETYREMLASRPGTGYNISLSMDAFAVSICKGLSAGRPRLGHCLFTPAADSAKVVTPMNSTAGTMSTLRKAKVTPMASASIDACSSA